MGVSDDEERNAKIKKSHNKWKDTHAKKAKVIKADNSKWDNNWDKINKQRAEIKAIKERKRRAKAEKEEAQSARRVSSAKKVTPKAQPAKKKKKKKKTRLESSDSDSDY